MERKFSFQGKEYDFEPLPRFALKEFSAAPTEKEWAELPAITSFRSRGTDDCAPVHAVCAIHEVIASSPKILNVLFSFSTH